MQDRRARRPFGWLGATLALLGLLAVACSPTPPPTDGVDLAVQVSDQVGAIIGSSVTYEATVSSAGTAPSTGPVAATVVVPPGQTVTTAEGAGWDCTHDAAQATCRITDADVAPGTSLPRVRVTADVAGPTYVAQVYAAINSVGDVNAANDQSTGTVTISPPVAGDQLFVQVAGALSLRSGGTVSSGDVSITPSATGGLGGADHLVIDATVGTTTVQADLQRQNFTLFSGPVTVTDPGLQGGVPLTVDWRGPLFGFGPLPWRNLQGELLGARIPSLDAAGVVGALANGLTFSLNLTAADYSPEPVPAGEPALSYSALNIADTDPQVTVPDRVVTGADVTVGTDITPKGGSTVGPVSATVDLPTGVDYVGAASGSTCTPVPAVPGRVRCTFDASLARSLRPNLLAGLAGTVVPLPSQSIGVRVRATSPGLPQTVRSTVTSANSITRSAATTFTALPPGPDVGLSLNGPEQTPNLYLTQGNGISGNQYNLAVDNAGTATSASPTVTLTLPPGVTYRSFTTSGISAATRFTCGAAGQVVTCTRPNGVGVTTLINPAPSFAVQVDVATGSGPVTATAQVANANDIDPGGAAKSASATTQVAAADAPTYDVSLSNGAFTVVDRPVLQGGYTFTTTPSGRLDAISGCGSSMNFVPAVLAVPIVGPTLVPAIYADNTLCVDVTRVPGTNSFAGTVRTDFVTAPVFLPPPVPQDLPLPPIIDPRAVSVTADRDATVTGPVSGSVSGAADGTSPQLVLNGGADFTTTWRITVPPSVTCTDIGACP